MSSGIYTTVTQRGGIRRQLVSEAAAAAARPWRQFFKMLSPGALHAIRHTRISSSPVSPAPAASNCTSSFFSSATQEINRGDNHPTNDTRAHTQDHAATPPHHQSPPNPREISSPPLEMCGSFKSDCRISFCRSGGKKKKGGEEREAMKMRISLSESGGPVASNLLRHSTSSASLFKICECAQCARAHTHTHTHTVTKKQCMVEGPPLNTERGRHPL